MKRRLLAVIAVVVVLGAALMFVSPVEAAPITRTYEFSAIGFSAFSAAVPPTDPVNGSVTLTFDPALTTLDFLVALVISDASTDHPAFALMAYTTAETDDTFQTSEGAVGLPAAAAVPEPGSWLVLASGLVGLLGYRSRCGPASAG